MKSKKMEYFCYFNNNLLPTSTAERVCDIFDTQTDKTYKSSDLEIKK